MAFASRNPSQLHRIRDARRLADALDNDAPQRDTANNEWFPDSANPSAHASTHLPDGGTDTLIVAVADEASLPTAGTQGRLRLARNGDGFFYDDGSQWVNLGKVSPMEVIASIGPNNLVDTASSVLYMPSPDEAWHNIFAEVRGEEEGSSGSLVLDGALEMAVLRNGVWISTPADEILIDFGLTNAGEVGIVTLPVSLEHARPGTNGPGIRVQAQNGPVNNVQIRLLGVRNP